MKGRDKVMAVKKSFPYRAAFVACKGYCGTGKESQDAENACRYGCIACGKCEEVCRFGAIAVRDNVACVDEELCIACKRCVKECPQGIIRIHECADYIAVKCSNKEKGKTALSCASSCIGCGICERVCTAEAIRVVENCAMINEELCLSCGMCAVKCPRHAIVDLRGLLTELS